MTLTALSDLDLAHVCGGYDDDGDSGSLPVGEDMANDGGGTNWMLEITCAGVGMALEGPTAVVGTVAGLGLRSIATAAPNLLPYLASTIGVSTAQDLCRTAGGGTTDLGNLSGTVTAP